MNTTLITLLILCAILVLLIFTTLFVLYKIITTLTNKLIQIEIIKKAETIKEAEEVGTKDLEQLQKIKKKEVKKAFVKKTKAEKIAEVEERIEKEKIEAEAKEWTPGVDLNYFNNNK